MSWISLSLGPTCLGTKLSAWVSAVVGIVVVMCLERPGALAGFAVGKVGARPRSYLRSDAVNCAPIQDSDRAHP
jgi:hypothetical protein